MNAKRGRYLLGIHYKYSKNYKKNTDTSLLDSPMELFIYKSVSYGYSQNGTYLTNTRNIRRAKLLRTHHNIFKTSNNN